MITIVDYGVGNIKSIASMLRFLGVGTVTTSDPAIVAKASKLILPGVGHFAYGMRSLVERDLIGVLSEKVLVKRTPVLGICLGAQLMTQGSEEGGVDGLGWIAASTRLFDSSRFTQGLRMPHMGWTDTEFCKENPLFTGVSETPRYYYVHSYHMVCDYQTDELCHAHYGYRFTSGIAKGNILGVQFHPEKSHRFGKLLLGNFANWMACDSSSERP